NVNSGSLVDLTKPVCTYDDLFESVPELGHNPFRDRICDVFSSEQGRKLNFLEFLDICSVFNENASQEAKIKRAFQIFDFDNDGFIGKGDISKVIKTIVPDDSNTNLNITDAVSDQIFKEFGGPEENKLLTKFQVQEMLEKSPEFADNFTFALQ
ncbi:hypothetical protein TCAL_08432, partial [Tigriopus californicus]